MIRWTLPFEVAADTLTDAVFLLDLSGHISWANQAAASAIGRSVESLRQLWTDGYSNATLLRGCGCCTTVSNSGELACTPRIGLLSSGPFILPVGGGPSVLAGVDPAALIAIGRDVSQRRLLDEQQRRADFQTLQFQVALLELARTESTVCRISLFMSPPWPRPRWMWLARVLGLQRDSY